jgi:hypothetical protein
MHRRKISLAILKEEVVELLLGLHLGAELIYADSGEVVLLHGNLLEYFINFCGIELLIRILFLIIVGSC